MLLTLNQHRPIPRYTVILPTPTHLLYTKMSLIPHIHHGNKMSHRNVPSKCLSQMSLYPTYHPHISTHRIAPSYYTYISYLNTYPTYLTVISYHHIWPSCHTIIPHPHISPTCPPHIPTPHTNLSYRPYVSHHHITLSYRPHLSNHHTWPPCPTIMTAPHVTPTYVTLSIPTKHTSYRRERLYSSMHVHPPSHIYPISCYPVPHMSPLHINPSYRPCLPDLYIDPPYLIHMLHPHITPSYLTSVYHRHTEPTYQPHISTLHIDPIYRPLNVSTKCPAEISQLNVPQKKKYKFYFFKLVHRTIQSNHSIKYKVEDNFESELMIISSLNSW